MQYLTVFFIAVALSADIIAVSVAHGICVKKPKPAELFKISGFFGVFHIIMLSAGWFGGQNLKNIISGADHWIAFGLLSFVGLKMLIEAFKSEHKKTPVNTADTKTLLLTATATSIDALAVGISFSLLDISIISACAIIGGVTFILSFIAALLGCKLSSAFGKKAEILGGAVLIFIGIKILLGHIK